MRQILDTYLDKAGDFLWTQFQKDVALSEQVVDWCQSTWETVHDFFNPRLH